MLHVFGRVNYFFDGITLTSSPRGATVPLFTTGAPLTDKMQAKLTEIVPRIPGYGAALGTNWKLHSVQITHTRVWACSSAKFTIVTPYVPGELLKLPPIHPEMPISIDLGYTRSPYASPLTPNGDTDPVEVKDEMKQAEIARIQTLFGDKDELAEEAELTRKKQANEPVEAWRPRRRFMGYVDTLQVKVTAKRIICTVSARDKLRFLVDNRMVGMFNSKEIVNNSADALKDKFNFSLVEKADVAGHNYRLRQEIVRALIESGSNGGISAADLSSDPPKDKGDNYQLDFHNIDGFLDGAANEHLLALDDNGNPLKTTDNQTMNAVREKLNPVTSVTKTEKPDQTPDGHGGPIKPNDETSNDPWDAIANNFIVMNKAPIEPLKKLSSLESNLPKELYADHNGKVHWTRRTTHRWQDPWKYHLLTRPGEDWREAGTLPTETSMPVISATAEFSTIATINEIIICNPQYQAGNASSTCLAAFGRLEPSQVYGFPMISRTRFIFDDTLSVNEMSGQDIDALIRPVMDAEFMIWGKDVRGGEVEVVGNPALYPGDAVKVYNMPFFTYMDKAGTAVDESQGVMRTDGIVETLIAEGPKKGYRSRLMLATPLEVYQDILRENKPNVVNLLPNGDPVKNKPIAFTGERDTNSEGPK